MAARPTPFDLFLADLAEARFPALSAALDAGGTDSVDRDALLLVREAVEILRDLRPGEGLGEGIGELAALLHHAFLFWKAGRPVAAPDHATLDRALGPLPVPAPVAPGGARYVQLPARQFWAELGPGLPAEPLDGFFVHPAGAGLRALGVFGLHPGRDGFTVVEVEGPRPAELVRPDGTPLFSATLAGGAAAGLHSLTGAEELLELAWRVGGLT
jgi:hypothetical protein